MAQTKILYKNHKDRLVKTSVQNTVKGVEGTLFVDKEGYLSYIYEYAYGSVPRVAQVRSTNPRVGYGSRLEDCLWKVDFTIISTLAGADVTLNLELLLPTKYYHDLYIESIALTSFNPNISKIEDSIKEQLLQVMKSTSDIKDLWVNLNKWRSSLHD